MRIFISSLRYKANKIIIQNKIGITCGSLTQNKFLGEG